MDKQLQVRYDDVQTLQQRTARLHEKRGKKPSMREIVGYSEAKQMT